MVLHLDVYKALFFHFMHEVSQCAYLTVRSGLPTLRRDLQHHFDRISGHTKLDKV